MKNIAKLGWVLALIFNGNVLFAQEQMTINLVSNPVQSAEPYTAYLQQSLQQAEQKAAARETATIQALQAIQQNTAPQASAPKVVHADVAPKNPWLKDNPWQNTQNNPWAAQSQTPSLPSAQPNANASTPPANGTGAGTGQITVTAPGASVPNIFAPPTNKTPVTDKGSSEPVN